MECETFFHVPGIYFSTSINRSLFYIVLLIFIIATPFLLMWFESRCNPSISRYIFPSLFAVLVGASIPLISLFTLSSTITFHASAYETKLYAWMTRNSLFTFLFLTITGIIALLFFIFLPLFKIKKPARQRLVSILATILILPNLCLLIWSTMRIVNLAPENKAKYEIASNEDGSYLVLSRIDGNVLVVNYAINDANQYFFDSDTYWLVDESKFSYAYIRMGTPPAYKDLDNSTNSKP